MAYQYHYTNKTNVIKHANTVELIKLNIIIWVKVLSVSGGYRLSTVCTVSRYSGLYNNFT